MTKQEAKELLKDEYVKEWLTGLSDRTKENYLRYLPDWNQFLGMTPTEQINKRMKDLTTTDLTQRNFFENKFREYKAHLEASEKLSAISVKTALISVASFFTRTVGALNLRRGDWNSSLETRIKNKLTLKLDDVKAMYAHGSLRDRCLLLILSQSGFSEVDITEFHIEDMKGFYESPISVHYFIEKCREKTGEVQATCLSFEAMHDLRDLLAERGNPKEGFLFVSQTRGKGKDGSIMNEGIEVRRIHEAMSNLAERTFGKDSEKAQGFKTKMLRSLYNSALLRADIKQEIKDLMMGHQRLGARSHYGYDSQTILEAYEKAFPFISINGMQSREDLAKIKADFTEMIGNQTIEIQQRKKESDKLNERISYLEHLLKTNNVAFTDTLAVLTQQISEIHRELAQQKPKTPSESKNLDELISQAKKKNVTEKQES
jgi:integrase